MVPIMLIRPQLSFDIGVKFLVKYLMKACGAKSSKDSALLLDKSVKSGSSVIF